MHILNCRSCFPKILVFNRQFSIGKSLHFVLIRFFRLSSLLDFFKTEITLGLKKVVELNVYLTWTCFLLFSMFSLRNKTAWGEGYLLIPALWMKICFSATNWTFLSVSGGSWNTNLILWHSSYAAWNPSSTKFYYFISV